MVEAKALSKNLRVPPRKARLIADLVRGLQVDEASLQLQFCPQKTGRFLKKTLDSAVANAETLHSVQKRDLIIKEVRVDAGPVLKRAKSRSKGSRVPVMKRTSHFTVVVGVREGK